MTNGFVKKTMVEGDEVLFYDEHWVSLSYIMNSIVVSFKQRVSVLVNF